MWSSSLLQHLFKHCRHATPPSIGSKDQVAHHQDGGVTQANPILVETEYQCVSAGLERECVGNSFLTRCDRLSPHAAGYVSFSSKGAEVYPNVGLSCVRLSH